MGRIYIICFAQTAFPPCRVEQVVDGRGYILWLGSRNGIFVWPDHSSLSLFWHYAFVPTLHPELCTHLHQPNIYLWRNVIAFWLKCCMMYYRHTRKNSISRRAARERRHMCEIGCWIRRLVSGEVRWILFSFVIYPPNINALLKNMWGWAAHNNPTHGRARLQGKFYYFRPTQLNP